MAYYLYNRTHENGRYRFVFQGETYLFGCNSGVVAKALKDQIPDGQQPSWRWLVNVPDALRQQNSSGNVFVIDDMPNNNELSYYELLEVWGCSYEEGYSSALLRLRSLLTGQQDEGFDHNDFTIDHEGENEPIFTFVYFNGSIENGQRSGTFRALGLQQQTACCCGQSISTISSPLFNITRRRINWVGSGGFLGRGWPTETRGTFRAAWDPGRVEFMAQLSLQILQVRQHLGLSQEDVAKKANITQQQLSKLEHGVNCNVSTLLKVCNALGVIVELETPAFVENPVV